jgi:hypothetical protein
MPYLKSAPTVASEAKFEEQRSNAEMNTKYNRRNAARKLILISTAIASFIMGGSALAESDAQLNAER